MENKCEDQEEDNMTHGQLCCIEVSSASSNSVLLSKPRDVHEGLVNPAFSQGDSTPSCHSRHSSQWRRLVMSPRWGCLFRDPPSGHCRSLSSSVENMTFSGAPLMRGSFPSLNDPVNTGIFSGGNTFGDDTSLRDSNGRGIFFFNIQNRIIYPTMEGLEQTHMSVSE